MNNKSNFVLIDPDKDHFFSNPIRSNLTNYHAKYSYLLNYEEWNSIGITLTFAYTSFEKDRAINGWRRDNMITDIAQYISFDNYQNCSGKCFALSAKRLIYLYLNDRSAFEKLIRISARNTICMFLNHFMTVSKYFTKIFPKIKNLVIICERSPLTYEKYLTKEEISFFQSAQILQMPYFPRSSLEVMNRDKERITKCAIVGTSHSLNPAHTHVIRTKFTSFSTIREKLRMLHQQKRLDYHIFSYYGSVDSYKATSLISTSFFLRFFLKIRYVRGLMLNTASFVDKYLNRKYYNSFSIENVLETHTFSLCGEEDVLRLPVIGFFESLRSGCIPLGSLHDYYASLGLFPNQHYIPYDGTYEDAKIQILRYSNSYSIIKNMQTNISNYAHDNFSSVSLLKQISQFCITFQP